jgi:hypothetical protein
MEQQNMPSIASQNEAPVTQKLPYAPPQTTFVPLKLEERLMSCNKSDPSQPACDRGPFGLLLS